MKRRNFLAMFGVAGAAVTVPPYAPSLAADQVVAVRNAGRRVSAYRTCNVRIRHLVGRSPQGAMDLRVFDVDTGEELTQHILIEYSQKVRQARSGEMVSFCKFKLNDKGQVYIDGDRLAVERLKCLVKGVEWV